MKHLLVAVGVLVACLSPALAEERLVCILHGDDYPRDLYPDGMWDTWYIDGDRLMQSPAGSPQRTVPGMSWMQILQRDDDMLVAQSLTIVEGASHRLVVHLRTGETTERSYFEQKLTENVGTCRLEEEIET